LFLVGALVLGGCPADECTPHWTGVFHEGKALNRSVLAVWEGSPTDVYLVGGGVGTPGLRGLVMHFDGSEWTVLDTGRDETLWWVWGPDTTGGQAASDVWMVGEHGLILRWNGQEFSTLDAGIDTTLYGVWGASAEDVWIVGGKPVGGKIPENDVVLHWDGLKLSAEKPTPRGAAYFKVWGASADDLWVAGEGGTLLRYTQAKGWEDYSGVTQFSLTTVHGCSSSEIYAVGRRALLGWNGVAWSPLDGVSLMADVNGVSCSKAGVLVVGSGGLKLRLDRASKEWRDETFDVPWDTDYHGAFAADDGHSWAVGGNFMSPTTSRTGVVAYHGCDAP
jgi:hypothetical protein